MNGLENLFVSPWYWLIGGLILAGLEVLVAGVFLLWIGLGAMLVGLLLLLLPGLPFAAQLLIFAVAMLGSIGLGFFIQRRSGPATAAQQMNRELTGMVGRHCEAASDFAAGRGRIRVGDTTYGVLGDDTIRAGEIVEIVSADATAITVARTQGSEIQPPA